MLKRVIKSALHNVLAYLGPERLQFGSNPRLVVLMYHRVLPEQHPDRASEQAGMYVSPETFAMHMQELQQRFVMMHLSDWLQKERDGESLPDVACAVTFDDGWDDNYQYAYPILKKYAIPATIYVVADYVGTQYSFWPNRLARALMQLNKQQLQDILTLEAGAWLKELDLNFAIEIQAGLSQKQIDSIIEQAKCLSEPVLKSKLVELEEFIGCVADAKKPDMVSWAALKEMSADGLVQVGSHTCEHARLIKSLPQDILHKEVIDSKQKIQQQLGVEVKTFCYPNGDFTDEAVQLVAQHYDGACTTRLGWNKAGGVRCLLNRIGVHEDISSTRKTFLARLSGWI